MQQNPHEPTELYRCSSACCVGRLILWLQMCHYAASCHTMCAALEHPALTSCGSSLVPYVGNSHPCRLWTKSFKKRVSTSLYSLSHTYMAQGRLLQSHLFLLRYLNKKLWTIKGSTLTSGKGYNMCKQIQEYILYSCKLVPQLQACNKDLQSTQS